MIRRIFKPFGALALAMLLQGYVSASAADQSTDADQIVRERAAQRWQALLAGDLERAYSFVAPSFRAVFDLDRYRARVTSAVNRKGAEVVSVTCAEQVCEANVRVEFVPPLRPATEVLSTHVIERWVFEEGGWWLHQQL